MTTNIVDAETPPVGPLSPSWRWWDAPGIYIMWILAVAAAQTTVADRLGGSGLEVLLGVSTLAGAATLPLVVLAWVMVNHPQGGLVSTIGNRLDPTALVTGAKIGLVGFVGPQLLLGGAAQALARRIGLDVASQQQIIDAVTGSTTSLALMLLTTCLVVPIGEELLFRGVLLQSLRLRTNNTVAITISAVAFGLVHGRPVAIVVTTAFGMLLGWCRVRAGTVWAPVVAHATFNGIAAAITLTTNP